VIRASLICFLKVRLFPGPLPRGSFGSSKLRPNISRKIFIFSFVLIFILIQALGISFSRLSATFMLSLFVLMRVLMRTHSPA
jgi:hypothetical protein